MADSASTSQEQASTSSVHSSSKFRAYAKEVDRALKFFETTNEWADLIAALGKLAKVLQSSSKNFSEVPKSVIVAKRLSQCLHPALPSGVHLKALDVYKQLFIILQRGDNMSKELYLYAIGLFPLMDHCGIKVKTELLTIFEQFFLPLGDSLKPSLPGFIATILIGLEEGTEFFARSSDLLQRLIDVVGNEAFFASLWEAVLHSPSVRLPALYFVNSKFDKRKPLGEQFLMVAGGDHVDHMIAALCAVAEDFSGPVLMHRHLLDFLLAAFPLNSAHVTQADFVQLLRRCLFIVLRRDMSLTRRIYQWLLNKSDSTASVLPTNSEEEEVDIVFFDTYSLPLIKLSIVEFLKLDTIEIPMPKSVMGAAGGAYEGPKEHVMQFTEVRLCRALQYFLDRPPFGLKILEEVLSIFLEYCCIQDQTLITNLTKKCEELDSMFSPDWIVRVEMVGSNLTLDEKEKRLDEIKKNLNALLNNLDVGYLWSFLSRFFKRLLESKYKNESDEEDMNLTDEERQKRDFQEEKRKEHIVLFPVMVSFCLQNVQLDNHSDIRSIYLPELLKTILSSITQHGCDKFTRDNLVALLAISRNLLAEINQTVGTVDNEEQRLIESCFKSCYEMIVTVSDWYVAGRDRDKTGVLCAASAFLRDFGDFPIYCYDEKDLDVFNTPETVHTELPNWVKRLLMVIDVDSWKEGTVSDFDVRSRIVDLLIFVYVRSVILIDQHKAIRCRDEFEFCPTVWAETKTTTTILLKPMLVEYDITTLDSSKIFEMVGKILWYTLSLPEEAGEHQTSACLLHRLHSRNISDASSEIESIIVTDLCAFDKATCSDACRRFRKLWTLTRSSINENIYDGIPYKPFNRLIMELLRTVADDSLSGRNSSLKTFATAWFIDCSKHGDLPRIFQMLGTVLLNPATARISIQYLNIETRLTNETVKSTPADINCLCLSTESGRTSLHHVLHVENEKPPLLEEAQAHMLLYVEGPEKVNLGRAETIFRVLSLLVRSNRGANLGKMLVRSMIFNSTSTLPQTAGGGVNTLVEYFYRHYKSIKGEEFWFSMENQSDNPKPKHCSYFELFCAIALHYLRSYFLNSPTSPISEKDLSVSWDCKIAVLDFFTDLLREIISLITEIKSRELVNSILTIYRHTKLQRCLISFLLMAVPTSRKQTDIVSISADIAEFNTRSGRNNFGDTAYAYHRALLDFASIVISLEYQMNVGLHFYSEQTVPFFVEKSLVIHKFNSTNIRSSHPNVLVVELKLFISVIVNALQKLPERHELWLQFLINILPFLEKALPTICIHVVDQLCRNIDTCITYAYGYTGATTFDNASIAEEALLISPPKIRGSLTPSTEIYPENYSLVALEALTTIMHFCMLEAPSVAAVANSASMGGVIAAPSIASTSIITSTGGSPTHSMNSFTGSASANPPSSTTQGNSSGAVVSAINMIPGTKGATEMLGNLFNKVFTSNDTSGNVISAASKYDQKSAADIWRQAKNELLKKLPQFLSTICDVWAVAQKGVQPRLPIGTGEQLKQRVFDLINPVAKRHPNALLNALSVVWMNRASVKAVKPDVDQLCFTYSDEQLTIANLLLELKVLPFQHAIYSIAECLKDLYKSTGSKTTTVAAVPTEESTLCEIAMLELLHGCVRLVPPKDLHDCWSALNFLFSEAPPATLSPRGVFLEFKILDDFVRICGSQTIIDDKQTSRAIQEACQKLADAVNFIVAWQLETTSWLKRTVVVRQDFGSSKSGETTPVMETKSLSASIEEAATSSNRGSTTSLATKDTRFTSHYDVSGNAASQLVLTANQGNDSVKDTNNNKKDPYYSTQALFLLAESLAELIDSITKSEDKEKLLPTLQAVWANALPYLKVKSAKNARFFLASSQFLASMSSFTYMRSVWKKSALDLLFDSSFFKMDIHSLKQWLVVIDNLMTNEKACFKELMAKIPTTPNTGITSLMINKDQEYESRAQALKRLAFVLLSSQMEQYGPQLPDIQERLSDNLRLSQVPLVHAQVFTCFRVLLIRFPSLSFVSIWPPMATELVQVLLQIENQLQQIAANDTASMASSNNTGDDLLRCARDDQWMQLYLAACKLLETLCTLPSGYVSQFQTCHWAFISSLGTNSTTDPFVPFAVRIHQLLCEKYGALSVDEQSLHSASLQNIKTLTSFTELRPFFHALASQHTTVVAGLTGNTIQQECFLHDATSINGSMTRKNAIARLEHSLYVDFAEHLQL